MRFRGKEYESLEDLIGDEDRFNPVFFWAMSAGGVLVLLAVLSIYLLYPPQ
jgi:hypothetical protein